MNKEQSMLAMFHNQKDDDFDAGNNVIRENWDGENKYDAESKKIEECFKGAIEKIKSSQLEESFRNDAGQKSLLEKTQNEAVEKMIEILRSIKEYMMTIQNLDEVKIDRENDSQETYIQKIDNAEKLRERKHNALIADVQSTIRFISYNFGQISQAALEKWEEEREERNLPVLKVKRQKFPKNVICPDNVDIRDRKQIAAWARKIFAISLDKIKKGLA